MTSSGDSREFWRAVVTAGGYAAIPHWSEQDSRDTAAYVLDVPMETAAAVRGLADELSVPVGAVLLAAHAKVIAALTGETEVVTGILRSLPCRITVSDGTWRELVTDAARIGTLVARHSAYDVEALRRELGLTTPAFETSLNAENTPDVVLSVSVDDDITQLRLTFRTDVVDAEFAARAAGYHLTALRLATAGPDEAHHRQSLLSWEERKFQIEGLAGPVRELPDARFHELFERQVRQTPDAVAAMHGDRTWTYAELNRRANRIARALLARGVDREDVVAVVTERNLDWMASVIAIFKAGACYLPIEPHFPVDRVAVTVSRSGCRLVLTEADSIATVDQALGLLPDADRVEVAEIYAEAHEDTDLGVRVEADQLAYIYFTSGSTGQPKGAMCEHAGMLNHLLAKIEDLEIGPDQVVAQTAPQCFDISLWQLVSALLVGGRTLIVEQEVILDVERFVDRIAETGVNVMQLVPSYLEVVLSYLEQRPRELPRLRYVSATGEALKKELVQRWFASKPDIRLVNAYGLTETSDDTNHEVMDRAPDRDRVPLGPAVRNVRVLVVDDNLEPVPLGAPGEIVFAGVCVGRGYINDPERTAAAFRQHNGERIYRAGDFGRWLPEGKLEFLGRRDAQVKIRGFRIEIGEIENQLLRVSGVRDGAVVVTENAGGAKQLVAFYAADGPLPVELLRGTLAKALPEYMVPGVAHWRQSLPLTANSKIDKKALTALAAELEQAVESGGHRAPQTDTERRLAAAWAEVLGVPVDQIGRDDHFFDRGGTSLSAVRLAIRLERAVSLKDLIGAPMLSDLAGVIDGRVRPNTGLLHELGKVDQPAATLVCFPYAAGNAVNYQPMARELRAAGISVYAVELPGHDVTKDGEPFVGIDQVTDQIAAEIRRRGLTSVQLWGHSSGTAFAVETARKLGDDVRRVFVAAQQPGDKAEREQWIETLHRRSDAELAAGLSTDSGYAGLSELDSRQAQRVGAAYRQDCLDASNFFLRALTDPGSVRLACPVTVVLAAHDSSTPDVEQARQQWSQLAADVEVHQLPEGGHHFLRTHPDLAAEAVAGHAALTPHP